LGKVLSEISLKKRTNVSFLFFFVGFGGFLDPLDMGICLERAREVFLLNFALEKHTSVSFFIFVGFPGFS
jgi:hypothetical protein